MRLMIVINILFLLASCNSTNKAHNQAVSGEAVQQVSRKSELINADIDPFIQIDTMTEKEVIRLFSKLQHADQQWRDSLYNGRKENEVFFNQKIRANNEANLKILEKIIQKFGWPKKSIFGEEAAETAWLIIWHHRNSRHTLCRYFDLMEKAVHEGEMSAPGFREIKNQVEKLSPDQINY